MRNLDITTLRSFIAVSDSGGVTRAAAFLNLTQSAVSMQIKRLEESLDLTLLDRQGRGVALTSAGEQLLTYARRIVELNDEVYGKLTNTVWEGEVVLGVPHDIIYPAIPNVMKAMQRDFPRVKVQLLSSYTSDLKDQFARGTVDVILTTETKPDSTAEILMKVPLRWYGAPGGQAWKNSPIPVAFGNHCSFRPVALRSLEDKGATWDLVLTSDSDRAIDVAVSADLAITSVLEGHEPPQFEAIPSSADLPDLGHQSVALYRGTARSQIIEPLCTLLRREFASISGVDLRAAAE
ncbi:LysR family transcriptional regulator [Marivita sp. S6314]|uniref:LysR family transcriptional regulator n=1 Tax=Marivita sp. S6314 TaxID=2926406 RepID=UPI001FF3E148|nr:LysR family transcriptional regulator [Marivita sp. S6314]MCK0149113.1 LysR family transcriptional regulator [Marivita sp. S6314]